MSRPESEAFLQNALDKLQALDKSVVQHQIVRDTTSQQAAQEAQQSFADSAAAVHMDDIATHMPATVTIGPIGGGDAAAAASSSSSSSSGNNNGGRPTLIAITPPGSAAGGAWGASMPGVSISNNNSSNSSSSSSGGNGTAPPGSPLGTRSPGQNGRVLLSPNPGPLDPSHLQVDEVSLRASPTSSTGRRVSPIDAHSLGGGSPGSSPSPPTSPLASPNTLSKKRLTTGSGGSGTSHKPLNLPSSPRLTSPSPPRSPARHIASPVPQARSPQSIRQFYFPDGVPPSPHTRKREQDLIEQLFNKAGNNTTPGTTAVTGANTAATPTTTTEPSPPGMTVEELFPVTTLVCGLSSYCNSALFDKLLTLQNELNAANGVAPTSTAAAAATGPAGEPALQDQPRIQLSTFLHFHAREIEKFDLPTRFFRLLRTNEPPPAAATAAGAVAGTTAAAIASPASSSSSSSAPAASSSSSSAGVPRKYLTRDDFKPIVQEIVNRHPGLEFLESTPEFQLKYAQTVIARIFYMVNRMGNEQLTLRELRTSNFLLMLALLDQEDDINKLNDYFSYEHFYVVYCKFWELDEDHDGYIDAHDLIQYDDYALTQRVVDRIMAGAGRKLLSPIPGKMNYLDFVIFLISEVDKNNDVALEYCQQIPHTHTMLVNNSGSG
jgi:serine/threonine-protein phosphatase 2A regulatory subunit B''